MGAILIAMTIGLPWLGAASVWGVGDRHPRAQNLLAVGAALGASLSGLGLLFFTSDEIVLRISLGGVWEDLTFVPDGLGVFLTLIATMVGGLAVLFSVDYMRGEADLGRYYALVLLFIGAMVGLVLNGSLLGLFIFWEITALCSYALIAFDNDNPQAVAGGVKALLITQVGGVGLLVVALLAYANLGTYDIRTFLATAHTLPPVSLTLMAYALLIAAAAKSAQVPFHTWLPDAMEAPTPVSALIHAATMVNAGVYVLIRFYPALATVPGWTTTVIIVGLASTLLAGLMALVATDLKRVLAYSTISQLGYLVCAVGAGASLASAFHLLSHAVFKALLFLGAGAVIHALGTRDLRQMGRPVGQALPVVRRTFVIGALALAGIPFLNGFWSKELLLEASAAHGSVWLTGGLLLSAALTALYAFRVVWLTFYAEAGESARHAHIHPAPLLMRVTLITLVLGTLTTWLLVGPLGHSLALSTHPTWEVVLEILTAPLTYVTLTFTALGLAAWWWREHWSGWTHRLHWLARAATQGFGFEWMNQWVINVTLAAAQLFRRVQTGDLNWNMVGLVGGLLVVLLMALGGG